MAIPDFTADQMRRIARLHEEIAELYPIGHIDRSTNFGMARWWREHSEEKALEENRQVLKREA